MARRTTHKPDSQLDNCRWAAPVASRHRSVPPPMPSLRSGSGIPGGRARRSDLPLPLWSANPAARLSAVDFPIAQPPHDELGQIAARPAPATRAPTG